ncbi:MAG: hypothetical protein JJ931_15740 [Henriciella sp.]|nr:hypothetical protein [Henriciella sp.]MBO6696859.1 hypothetical protein [Henriciella sp.]
MRHLVIGGLALALCGCDDLRMYSEYEDLNAVRADGAFERGWFPTWMPGDAVDIHEYHDLDTNIQAISFRIENDGEFEWPERCTVAIKAAAPRLKTKRFPKAVHKLDNVLNCRDYFVVRDERGTIHMWSMW